MSDLIEKIEEGKRRLADAVAGAVDKHAEEWAAKGLAEARELALDLPADSLERASALAALDALVKREGDVVLAGKVWALEALARFGAGRPTPEDLELISRSSYAERRAALHAATDAAHADHLARLEARRQLLRVAQEVGAAAIRAAIPFLLAAL